MAIRYTEAYALQRRPEVRWMNTLALIVSILALLWVVLPTCWNVTRWIILWASPRQLICMLLVMVAACAVADAAIIVLLLLAPDAA